MTTAPPLTKIPVAPMPRPPAPPTATRTPPPAQSVKLDMKPRKVAPICPRILMIAVEKWGKTTLIANAPDPIVLMARGETGYDTLLGAGSVPACPAAVMQSWPQTLDALDQLIADPQGRKTVGMDALGGLERLCHEHVCDTAFKGDWSDSGFASYNKGYELAAGEWLKLIQKLDTLHDKHGIITIIAAHAKVKPFNDPLGPAYDRFVPDAHEKTWAPTSRWSDCILFGKFQTYVDVANKNQEFVKQKGKAYGGTERVLYTRGCDAYVAGNRYSMEPSMTMPSDPSQTWATVWNEIVRDKSKPTE